MSRKLTRLLFTLLLLLQGISSFASHIYGGELLYTHISGNTYKLTFTVYGDCAAVPGTFNSLYIATPIIEIYNGNSFVDTFSLKPDVVGTEVSPVCPSQIDSTTCNGGTLPGVKQFIYSDTVTLPGKSTNWRFIFSGDMGGVTIAGAGRSNNITNITSPGVTIMQIEADLNNSLSDNSSPQYSTIPTPFYCVNVLEQYNQGAIDPDGDSLSFSLVAAIDANSGVSVSYISPYTPTDPLSTDSSGFNFNSLNGQMTFTPSITQDGLVVCRVSEYRAGVLIGTSEREMTFVVLNNCNGTPPNLAITTVSGGTITGSTANQNVINTCVGTPNLSFALSLSNPDGDNTTIANSTLPGTSSLNIVNNNSASPSATFNWNTSGTPPGIYTFFVTVKNNHCPISNTQTIAYTIDVTSIPTLSAKVLVPTECVHQAYIQYNLAYGFLPRQLTIFNASNNVILTYTDTTGIIKDSLPLGSYTVVASSDPLCTVSLPITITDSGSLPLDSFAISYCVGDPEQPIPFTPFGDSAKIYWYDGNNNFLSAPPIPNTSVMDVTNYFVTEVYKVCTASHIMVTAIVHPLPMATIINTPQTICLGDTVFLEASGGVQYSWSPQDEVFTDKYGRIYTRVLASKTLTVDVTDRYGCSDSTSITYSNIQPCCNFVYPNAFTPNGDGRNDGFRVITYGNMAEYKLTIFNRWGQVVFDTNDPRAYWDGTRSGAICDIGTYFYYFRGTCLTGRTEEYKGDVTLIR